MMVGSAVGHPPMPNSWSLPAAGGLKDMDMILLSLSLHIAHEAGRRTADSTTKGEKK